jgi:AAA domain
MLGAIYDRGGGSWLVRGSDLLAEPDPGPTKWLVENLMVDEALVAMVGRWKTTKSYAALELLVSVATGTPAFGSLPVAKPGPVIYVCEESGRAALWRRLDALCRGRATDRDALDGLFLAANQRVKLDDPGWQRELVAQGRDLKPRLYLFDPLARMKAAAREENAQTDMAPLIEYMRELRDETGAGVAFVHHTGHQGDHMRGSSDLESAWETKLKWKRDGGASEVKIEAEHREAETSPPIRYRISWDAATRTIRFPLITDDTLAQVRAYLIEHPDASANTVFDALGGSRAKVLEAVKTIREEGGTEAEYHPGTTGSGAGERGGTPEALSESPGTTTAEPPLELVPNDEYHPLDEAPFWSDDEVADWFEAEMDTAPSIIEDVA